MFKVSHKCLNIVVDVNF